MFTHSVIKAQIKMTNFEKFLRTNSRRNFRNKFPVILSNRNPVEMDT
jgi:hypothetical protein